MTTEYAIQVRQRRYSGTQVRLLAPVTVAAD